MPSNNIRGANHYDSAYVLADTQTSTSDEGGKNSGGSATYIDLDDYAGSVWVAHLRYTAADYTNGDETYEIQIHSSSATNFSTYVIEKQTTVPVTATVSAGNKYQLIGGFSPQNRYVRAYINVGGTSPSITIDKIWAAPLGC